MPDAQKFVQDKLVYSKIEIGGNEFIPPNEFEQSNSNLTFTRSEFKLKVSNDFPFGVKPMFFLKYCDDVILGLINLKKKKGKGKTSRFDSVVYKSSFIHQC